MPAIHAGQTCAEAFPDSSKPSVRRSLGDPANSQHEPAGQLPRKPTPEPPSVPVESLPLPSHPSADARFIRPSQPNSSPSAAEAPLFSSLALLGEQSESRLRRRTGTQPHRPQGLAFTAAKRQFSFADPQSTCCPSKMGSLSHWTLGIQGDFSSRWPESPCPGRGRRRGVDGGVRVAKTGCTGP